MCSPRLNGGEGPDSITADAEGNIYAAHFGSREVVVFAPNGDYYGAIELPAEAGTDVTNVVIRNGYLYVTEARKGAVGASGRRSRASASTAGRDGKCRIHQATFRRRPRRHCKQGSV